MRLLPRSLFLLATLVAVARPCASQPPAEVVKGETGHAMDRLVARAAAFGFSGQVLVVREGEVLLHKAYGFADRARGRRMTLATPIGIASMSKQFTAAAILDLASRGRISLDDPVARWVPGVPASHGAITIAQVVHHTSGIRGGKWDDFAAPSRDSMLHAVLAESLESAPGAEWAYATEAYGLLAAVVDSVTGVPFESWMRDSLFARAGMRTTGFWSAPPAGEAVAHAYLGWHDRGAPDSWPRNWRVRGAGDIVTTTGDVLRWEQALQAGRVLPAAALAAYFGPGATIDSLTTYGFGLFVGRGTGGRRLIEHGGDTELGYNSAFFRYPDEKVVMVVLANARDRFGRSYRHSIQGELDSLVFGMTTRTAPEVTPIAATAAARAAGTYALESGDRVHLVSDGGLAWAAAEGQDAVAALWAMDAPTAARLDSASTRTRAALRAWLTGDPSRLVADAPDASRGAALVAELGEHLRSHGAPRAVTVLGTIARGPNTWTYARFAARDRDIVLAFRRPQQGRGPINLIAENAEFPVILPVAASANGEWIAHDPVPGLGGARFRIDRSKSGDDVAIRFTNGRVAKREPGGGLSSWRPSGRP